MSSYIFLIILSQLLPSFGENDRDLLAILSTNVFNKTIFLLLQWIDFYLEEHV